MAQAKTNGKVMKLWNPGPSLMIAGSKANTGQHRLQVVGTNPKRRRRRTTANPSSKQIVDLFIAALFTVAGIASAEMVGSFIASPIWKIVGKTATGFVIAFGGQHIPVKVVQANAGFAGAGALGSAGNDAISMFRSRSAAANMFLRPVRLAPGEVNIPVGAVLPADVLTAAKNGNKAAQRLIIEVQPYTGGDMSDIVWLPAMPGLSDVVYKQHIQRMRPAAA